MKLLTYIWRNITRNKIRSLLTILSVGFSLALMTVLYGFMASQETWKNGARHLIQVGYRLLGDDVWPPTIFHVVP